MCSILQKDRMHRVRNASQSLMVGGRPLSNAHIPNSKRRGQLGGFVDIPTVCRALTPVTPLTCSILVPPGQDMEEIAPPSTQNLYLLTP